ncbi:MAG: hypothetical protein KA371_22285 [Acidobacteria bacterium]|nr:hypothetical protein [Acidobacteriota bacterium]
MGTRRERRPGARTRNPWRGLVGLAVLTCAVTGASCGNVITPKYEYEEDVYLALDGSATVYVNASVAALVALRDAPLPLDPAARLDRNDVRAYYQGPGARVASVSTSRRDGRRYVHLRVEVDDIRTLSRLAPFSWSAYGLQEKDGLWNFTQQVTSAAGKDAGNVGWRGDELVAVRLHLPSRVPFHNAPSRTIERGNIITWEQRLTARAKGEPLSIEVHLERESILFQTLALFAGMALAAVSTLAVLIWWVWRKGKRAASQPTP